MFLLYDPAYPERTFPLETVREAWLAAGFPKFSARTRKDVLNSHDVRGLVNTALLSAGATLAAPDSGDFEVPDEVEPLLKALERFYLGLYPEMKDEKPPRNFYYEKLEWLGQI